MTTAQSNTPAVTTPERFDRDPAWAARTVLPLRILQRDRRPFTSDEIEWARRAVDRGDDLGNRMARAMIDEHAFSMADLDAALETGRTEVPALRELLDVVAQTPDWVDFDACARGAAVCRRAGTLGLDVLATASLMTGYTTSATTRQLVATGRLVEGVDARIHETTQWWARIIAPGDAIRPHHTAWRAAVKVRVIHGLANTTLTRRADWDRAEWGVPINQSDQLGTLGLFSTSFLVAVRALGMPVSAAEGRDVMSLWRYVGWLLGIDDHVLPATEGEGRRRMVQVGQYSPGPDADSVVLGRALYGNWGRHNYPVLQGIRRKVHQRYLGSLETVFAGPWGTRDLGIPMDLPWAVAVTWARHAPVQFAARFSPVVRRWATDRGEQQIATWLRRNEPAAPVR